MQLTRLTNKIITLYEGNDLTDNANRLYNVGGNLYFNGQAVGTGTGSGDASQVQANLDTFASTINLAYSSNDYNTYTTLVSLVNTVQNNVTAIDNNTWVNANDYATYTALISHVNSEVANLVNGAPTTLDTLNELAAALGNDANLSVTLSNQIGIISSNTQSNFDAINTVQNNVAALDNNAWVNANDFLTLSTAWGNDHSTLLSAYSNDGATLATARGNDHTTLLTARSNDYNTYTTLVSLVNTVQSNLTVADNNSWVNANDFLTLATARGNDHSTLLSAYSNDGATLATARGNDHSTLLSAYSNDGATLATARGNDHSTLLSAYSNDIVTLDTARGNDHSTLLSAYSNDGATLATARGNDHSTLLSAQANDWLTYTALSSNDGTVLSTARSNDYATYLNAQSNDGATLLTARSNDWTTYSTLAANDGITLATARGNDHSTLLSAYSNDYSTFLTAYSNDHSSYTTLIGLINTVQDNIGGGSQWSTSGTSIYYDLGSVSISSSVQNPASKLYVGGNTYVSGNVEVGDTLIEFSSATLKKNIVPLNSQLSKVLQLRPVEYEKIHSNTHEYGLISEEVAAIFPHLVKEGNTAIMYTRLIPALIQVIQELNIRLEQLEKKNTN